MSSGVSKMTFDACMNKQIKELIDLLVNLAKRNHEVCDDSWYSCPKSGFGCSNDLAGDECNCGADEQNKKVEEIKARLDELL